MKKRLCCPSPFKRLAFLVASVGFSLLAGMALEADSFLLAGQVLLLGVFPSTYAVIYSLLHGRDMGELDGCLYCDKEGE